MSPPFATRWELSVLLVKVYAFITSVWWLLLKMYIYESESNCFRVFTFCTETKHVTIHRDVSVLKHKTVVSVLLYLQDCISEQSHVRLPGIHTFRSVPFLLLSGNTDFMINLYRNFCGSQLS
jgi:hypothetical protein